jgi:Helix-turn-helix domain
MDLKPGIEGHWEWRKALHADQGLREHAANARKRSGGRGGNGGGVDIRYVAVVIADHGRNGRGCFAESATIAAEIGCHRNTVDSLRRELIQRGWFTVVSRKGGRNRRSLVLDISAPVGRTMEPGRSHNGDGKSHNGGLWTTREYLPESTDQSDMSGRNKRPEVEDPWANGTATPSTSPATPDGLPGAPNQSSDTNSSSDNSLIQGDDYSSGDELSEARHKRQERNQERPKRVHERFT